MTRSFFGALSLAAFAFVFIACGDDTEPTHENDATNDVVDAVSGDLEDESDGTSADRFTLDPTEMNGFGHEPVSIANSQCDWPVEPDVTVQGINAVLVEVSEDGCDLTFVPQGGSGGEAPIVVRSGDDIFLELDGLSYQSAVGGDLFESVWCVGDSLGAAMASWYLSYESQVIDGMFAFFFRQASAFCPHPLVRTEGVPQLITLADIDPEEGIVPTTDLMTGEMIEYLVGLRPLTELRLNEDMVACNQSVPGMHDVTWPFRSIIYDSSDYTAFYERLLRFPEEDLVESPTPIMDTIEAGEPSFIAVSLGVMAYALDGVYVSEEQLDDDLDAFLGRFLSMASEPVVALASMPDTASLPARPFSYAERYYNLRLDNQLYAAVARANADLARPRLLVVPTAELYLSWFAAEDTLQIGPETYPVTTGDDGRVYVMITDSEGHDEAIGLGRFEGFYSLDHVHLTATGHALVANLMLHAVNGEIGPDSSNAYLTEAIPPIDIASVLSRDPLTATRLQAEAVELGFPDLSEFLDPVPPAPTHSELCAIAEGPMAIGVPNLCPEEITLVVNSESCGDTPIDLPATINITVQDDGGNPLTGAAVGIAALPPTDHEPMTYLPGGLTDEYGQLLITVEADQIGTAQAGGRIEFQSGEARVSCLLPDVL